MGGQGAEGVAIGMVGRREGRAVLSCIACLVGGPGAGPGWRRRGWGQVASAAHAPQAASEEPHGVVTARVPWASGEQDSPGRGATGPRWC